MNLPPIDPALMAKCNAKPGVQLPQVDFGLSVAPTAKPKAKLNAEQCIKMFGIRDAVMMNFIPQMLSALALEQAEEYIRYCGKHRLTEYKKHNRQMRNCINEYRTELRNSYGPAYVAYEMYYKRLHDKVAVDLFKIWCTFTNEASRQFMQNNHKDIPARLALIKMLLSFVNEFDKQMDKVIESYTDAQCKHNVSPYLGLIDLLCLDLAEAFNCKMQITDQMVLCLRVLVNKAKMTVDEIIADEDADRAIRSQMSAKVKA